MINCDDCEQDKRTGWPAGDDRGDAFAIPERGAVRIFNGLMGTSLSSVEQIQAYLVARPEECERLAGAR